LKPKEPPPYLGQTWRRRYACLPPVDFEFFNNSDLISQFEIWFDGWDKKFLKLKKLFSYCENGNLSY